MSELLGRFVWYELLAADPAAALAFYPKVTGWGVDTFTGLGEPYQMWTLGGVPLGGTMALPAEAKQAGVPPHWLAYVGTPDVDATVAQAKGLGASVHLPPMDIPTVGRIAVLADPQGASFAVYAPASAPPPAGPPRIGEFSWHELATTDPAAAFAFYSTLFGWEKKGEGHDMGPLGIYQEYGPKDSPPVGGIHRKPEDMPAPSHFLLYVRVRDLEGTLKAVEQGGGRLLNGPMDVPGGDRIAQCLDSQGTAFALHQAGKAG